MLDCTGNTLAPGNSNRWWLWNHTASVCEVCQMKNGDIIQRFFQHWNCGPCFVWRTSDYFRTTNRAPTAHGTFEPLQLNGLFYQTLTCRIIESDVFQINPSTNGNVSHSMSSRTTSCQPDALKRISISPRHLRNLENCQRLLLFFLWFSPWSVKQLNWFRTLGWTLKTS